MYSMKPLMSKLYYKFAGPLYRRLSRELTLQHQQMMAELLQIQETLTKTISSELVQLHITVQQHEELCTSSDGCSSESVPKSSPELSKPSPSDYQVAQMLREINSGNDVIKMSRNWQLPVSDIISFERKYKGMDAIGVQRARRLEQENMNLRLQLSEMQLKQEQVEKPITQSIANADNMRSPVGIVET